MEKQAGIYARYSPGRDRDQTSTIEAQVAMCREKAGRDGVVIDADHIYVDRGSERSHHPARRLPSHACCHQSREHPGNDKLYV